MQDDKTYGIRGRFQFRTINKGFPDTGAKRQPEIGFSFF